MWAEIINVLFVKKNNTMTRRNTGVSRTIKYRYGNMVEKQLMYEQKFSLFQCKKILVQNKINYVDLFEKKDVYKESTQIFSYFVLKSIFMYHLNYFIEWCIEKNKDSLDFIKTKENIREYGNILEDYYLDRDYIQTIHEINIENSPEYIQKTLRMSVFG
jgi:hypothetical protein